MIITLLDFYVYRDMEYATGVLMVVNDRTQRANSWRAMNWI